MEKLASEIAACRICASAFAATASRHAPRPVVWFRPPARLLIASQAPGLRVHEAGTPFWDRSGARLRDWLGLSEEEFYDRSRVAILPMAFCFPGYDSAGSDLPPPRVCAETWRESAMAKLAHIELTLLVGGYAQRWHLGRKAARNVTETVKAWREHAPDIFSLPHPSWRNTAWLKQNEWFEADLLPALRRRVREVISA